MASSVRLRLCFKRPSSTCLDKLPTPLCVFVYGCVWVGGCVCVCPERASERERGREGERERGRGRAENTCLETLPTSLFHVFGCVHARARSCTHPTLPHTLPPISHFILSLSRFLFSSYPPCSRFHSLSLSERYQPFPPPQYPHVST
jgi:hypothetical protein